MSRKPDQDRLAKDVALLKEYGFRRRTLRQIPLNVRKMDGFGMRQLDRLKMLLLRNEALIGTYPPSVRAGLDRNSSSYFARALAILAPKIEEYF